MVRMMMSVVRGRLVRGPVLRARGRIACRRVGGWVTGNMRGRMRRAALPHAAMIHTCMIHTAMIHADAIRIAMI